MIIERRAYTLLPGVAPIFWAASQKWNSSGPYADVLAAHHLCFFETFAGPTEQILSIYKYESLDEWRSVIAHSSSNISAEYTSLMRPLLLQQDIGFYVHAPINELKPTWAGGEFVSPEGYDRSKSGNPSELCVVESILELRPGCLPSYWNAYTRFLAGAPSVARHHLLFVHNSIAGVLHRVLHYRWFASASDAKSYQRELDVNAHWSLFTEACRPWVVHCHSTLLNVAPLPWLRSIFESAT